MPNAGSHHWVSAEHTDRFLSLLNKYWPWYTAANLANEANSLYVTTPNENPHSVTAMCYEI